MLLLDYVVEVTIVRVTHSPSVQASAALSLERRSALTQALTVTSFPLAHNMPPEGRDESD